MTTYVIKNVSAEKIELAPGVFIDPNQQLDIEHLSDRMQDEADKGTLQIRLGEPTPEERKREAESFDPHMGEGR